jgi:hypothetical protein
MSKAVLHYKFHGNTGRTMGEMVKRRDPEGMDDEKTPVWGGYRISLYPLRVIQTGR